MSDLDPFFTYQIGDEVTLKAMTTPFKIVPSREPEEGMPHKLCITERIIHECPGGRQQTYICRALYAKLLETGFSAELFRFNEVELTRYPGTEKEA